MLILPFLDQAPLYNTITPLSCTPATRVAFGPLCGGFTYNKTAIPGYYCPSEPGSQVRAGVPVNYWALVPADGVAAISSYRGSAGNISHYIEGVGTEQCGLCVGGACPCDLGTLTDMGLHFAYNAKQNRPSLGMLWAGGISRRFAEVVDGSSNTLFVGESNSKVGSSDGLGCDYLPHWTSSWISSGSVYGINLKPASGQFEGCGFRSRHVGGAQFLMVDGSVRFLSDNINMVLFSGLATAAGSEVLGEF